MTTWIISGVLGFVTGGAFIWFFKDWILKQVLGAETFAAKLREKAASIRASL